MKKWYAKALSELANVSVRTLHYYDKIDLLKPSIRNDNDYRLYSEEDLSRLQQIIALKFFGFKLVEIKRILESQDDLVSLFEWQHQLLQKKGESLLEASEILSRISKDCVKGQSIPWDKTIQLIEVYQMTQALEHNWVKDIFNEEELREYAEFETKMKKGATANDKAKFEAEWYQLLDVIKDNAHVDPQSKEAIVLGKKYMAWVNKVYGKEYAHLRTKKFEKGFGEGKGLEDVGLTKELVTWLEVASNAYFESEIYALLNQVELTDRETLLSKWHALMDDMYGYEEKRKHKLIKELLLKENINLAAKSWLKQLDT
jgi:DNA-binding transcriptional MerR regulator